MPVSAGAFHSYGFDLIVRKPFDELLMVFIVNAEFFNLFFALTDGSKVRAASNVNTCRIGIDKVSLRTAIVIQSIFSPFLPENGLGSTLKLLSDKL